MSKNIEMNYNDTSGYEVIYPQNISNIVLVSDHLQGNFSLADNSVIDDAFDYINRKLILIQYNKAGINVTVKSAGGSPLEGVPIPGITVNYDGTGEVVTDSNGIAFGYCDAGNINIAPVNCADVTYTNQQIEVLASEMYDVEITGTVVNFVKHTSSGSLRFSNNVQSIDVTLVGGGGGGGSGARDTSADSVEYVLSGSGGGGGYCIVQESVEFESNMDYSFTIGSGGVGRTPSPEYQGVDGDDGGNSVFISLVANGGKGGRKGVNDDRISGDPAQGGEGNGYGGNGDSYLDRYNQIENIIAGSNGQDGQVMGYSSFTEMVRYGGGGGGGKNYRVSLGDLSFYSGGADYGARGAGGDVAYGGNATQGTGGGGGGALSRQANKGGNGGSGCLAIRMHLKVTA